MGREEREVAGVVVAGFGRWGRNHVRNYHALGALAGICEPSAPAREAAAASYPGVALFERFEAALAHDAVDGVVLATPAETHAPLARQALRAGKDVLSEKPLALSSAEAREAVALADAEGRILMVGHLLEYHPAVQEIVRLIRAGELGKLRYVTCHRLNLGRVRSEENVLWSFGPHDVAFLLRATGELPDAVASWGGAWLQPGIEDTVGVQLRFPSGVRAHVLLSWLHPFKEQRLVVVGERAMVSFADRPQGHELLLWRHRVEEQGGRPEVVRAAPEAIEVPAAEPLRRECEAFLHAIRTRERPLADGESGVRVLEVLERCAAAMAPSAAPAGCEVHPSAVVDPGASIGEGTRIWHYSHVMGTARVGARCVLGQNVFVGAKVVVGDGCKLQNNVSLYEGVRLGDEVFCGPSAVFTNVRTPRAHVERKDAFEETVVERRATIGANATVRCGVRLGEACVVAAGAVVTKDVPPLALVQGCPARVAGWMCGCGERLALEPIGAAGEEARCGRCGARYRRVESGSIGPR